jgi:hypothetical protein
MKNKLFTLAAALTLAAVIGSIYAAPALAAVIKAALIKNVDEKGRVPYSVPVSCTSTTGGCVGTAMAAVPNGMRFVVENINGTVRVFGTNPNVQLQLFQVFGNSLFYHFSPLFLGSAGGTSPSAFYVVNAPALIYFNQLETPKIEADAFFTATVNVNITLTGYLVDLGI